MKVVQPATDLRGDDDEKRGVQNGKISLNRFYVRDSGRIIDEGEGGAASLTKRSLR